MLFSLSIGNSDGTDKWYLDWNKHIFMTCSVANWNAMNTESDAVIDCESCKAIRLSLL